MPWSELLSLMLCVTSDDVVPERLMPAAVNPLARCPAPVTLLLDMVMWLDDDTADSYARGGGEGNRAAGCTRIRWVYCSTRVGSSAHSHGVAGLGQLSRFADRAVRLAWGARPAIGAG